MIKDCFKCQDLVRSRNQIVWGVGSPKAKIMFIGLCPGQKGANQTGIPFMGDISGNAFRKELQKLNYNFIYVTNLVKCSPPGNRPPAPAEIENCRYHLISELISLNPKLAVPIGAEATKIFLRGGSVIVMNGVRVSSNLPFWSGDVIPVVHPAYCARIGDFSLFEQGFAAIKKWIEEAAADGKI